MHNIHLETCSSTQAYLLDHLTELLPLDRELFVTTDMQTQGQGRRGHSWDFFPGNLAMSFTLPPRPDILRSTLEVGILVCDFFKEAWETSLGLKWPNDLLYNGVKCGGIIMHAREGLLVCGLGINLATAQENPSYKSVALFSPSSAPSPVQTAEGLYHFLLKQAPLSPEDMDQKFAHLCPHMQRPVVLKDGGQSVQGTFLGLAPSGAALIRTEEGEKREFLNGDLSWK